MEILTVGNLYYGNKELVKSDENLWSTEVLDRMSRKKAVESSDVKVAITQSTLDRTNMLDIDASLKMSFMGGLVKISGSANYLDDRRKKKNSGVKCICLDREKS